MLPSPVWSSLVIVREKYHIDGIRYSAHRKFACTVHAERLNPVKDVLNQLIKDAIDRLAQT